MRNALARFRDPGSVGFCLRFAIYTGTFFTAAYLLIGPEEAPFRLEIARAVGAIMRLLGIRATVHADTVTVEGFAVKIVDQCTGLYETGLLTAAILAFPASPGQRVVGILAGAAVIASINLVRIASLLLLGVFFPTWFSGAHLYAWQAILIAAVAGCWLAWAHRVRPLAGT